MTTFSLLVTATTGAGTQALYIANNSDPSTYTPWFGMVLQNTNATPKSSINFTEAWQADGNNNIDGIEGIAHYILLPSDPSGISSAVFLQNLVAYITNQQGKFFPRFFLWINDAAAFTAGGNGLNSSICFGPTPQGKVQVTTDSAINFSNIFLSIPVNTLVAPTTGNEGFSFTTIPGNSNMIIVVDQDTDPNPNITGVVQPVNFFVEGPSAFTFTFQLNLLVQGGILLNDFTRLEVGLKYFSPGASLVMYQLYPVFNLPDPSTETLVPFNASFDCFYPLVITRTFLQFQPTFADGSPVLFSSNFTTDYGHTVFLTPDGSTARLVLQPDKTLNASNVQVNTYHMAPQGNFYLSLDKSDTTANPKLICGLSGTETIQFTPAGTGYKGDMLMFQSGSPAYAASFVAAGSSGNASSNDPARLLSNTFTTSWITVVPSQTTGSTTYYAQPSSAALYANGYGVNTYAKNFLGFFEPPSKSFTPASSQSMPMVPYSNTQAGGNADGFTPAAIGNFETNILAPCRKATLTANKSLTVAASLFSKNTTAASVPSTTPQGLLALIDPNSGNYINVTLASNAVTNQQGVTTEYTLQLSNIDDTLRNALQTNQLCLVATTNTHIGVPPADNPPAGTPLFQNEMSIEGWPFLLDVGKNCSYGNYTNVMIFKFCPGKLKDVVANPSQWTQPQDFNNSNEVQAVSSWLCDYIANAEQQYLKYNDPYYENFYNIANTAAWNGILVLKTDISLVDFPQQLQGLLAGIDLSRFYGHHFGINVNHVTVPPGGGAPQMAAQSSLFGLIDYEDVAYQSQLQQGGVPDQPVKPQPGDYDFKVLLLKTLFENSVTKDFSSKVQLSIQKLFSDTVTLNSSAAYANYNCIVLNGSYQQHGTTASYVFDETGDNFFTTGTNVLQAVEVSKVQFNTLRNQGNDAATKVHSRFSLWGYLQFNALPKQMDVFSFGTGQHQSGLYFSNMYINMDFDVRTPSVKTFGFDTAQVAFDTQQSSARPDSIYNGFPMTPTGIIKGSGKDTPATGGYLKVGVPYQGSLADEWFGVVYKLNMGTAGALASDLGFSSTLLTAWSPGSTGTDQFKTQIGLQLPGTAGIGNLMSIEGVLKLAIDTLKLEYVPVQSGAGKSAYLLTMGNIALKFLGIVKIPPSATISCYLFGDPSGNTGNSSLAWYAAYVQDTQQAKQLSRPG